MASKLLSKSLVKMVLTGVLVMNVFAGIVPSGLTKIAYAEDPVSDPITGPAITAGSANETQITKAVDEIGCIFSGGGLSGSFSGCLIQGLYHMVFTPTQVITNLAGTFLDYFLWFSINNATYKSSNEFIEKGWGLVRDITNIVFIFALLVIAFNLILGTNFIGNPKKIFINIIIAGLLVNFSLFFVRVAVDAGNILATVFYNHMGVVNTGGEYTVGYYGEKNIALAVIDKSDPQKIWQTLTKDQISDKLYVTTTILAATVINIGLIGLFFSLGFLFLGRTVTLMIQMVFAPLAVVSILIPYNLGRFAYKKWQTTTLNAIFMAPVFLFFMYLVLLIQELQITMGYPNGSLPNNTVLMIINVILPYTFIWFLLKYAKNITKEMAGEISNQISDGLTKVAGMIGGAAITGGSIALTGGLGAAGAGLAAKTAGKTGTLSRIGNKIGNKAATSNFDFRSSTLGKRLQSGIKQSGGKLNLGTATDKTKGGFYAMQQNAIKKQTEQATKFSEVGLNEKVQKDIRNAHIKYDQALANTKNEQVHSKADIDDFEAKSKALKAAQEHFDDIKETATTAEKKAAKNAITQAHNDLVDTKIQKDINSAAKEVATAEKALAEEVKKRKNAYAELLHNDSIVGSLMTGSIFMSKGTTDIAYRKIKGSSEAKVLEKKKLQGNQTTVAAQNQNTQQTNQGGNYSQTNVNAQNIPSGNQQQQQKNTGGQTNTTNQNQQSSQSQNKNQGFSQGKKDEPEFTDYEEIKDEPENKPKTEENKNNPNYNQPKTLGPINEPPEKE